MVDVVFVTFMVYNLFEGMELFLDVDVMFDLENFFYLYGMHLCVVDVDIEMGWVTICKYVCVDDVG